MKFKLSISVQKAVAIGTAWTGDIPDDMAPEMIVEAYVAPAFYAALNAATERAKTEPSGGMHGKPLAYIEIPQRFPVATWEALGELAKMYPEAAKSLGIEPHYWS